MALPASRFVKNAFAEWRNLPRRSVSWSPERVDFMLEHPSASSQYAGLIAPEDFLKLTSRDDRIKEILNETGPLEEETLARLRGNFGRWIETPFLSVIPTKKGMARNTGHEGRHRSTAMARTGARELPVVVQMRSIDNADEPLDALRLTEDEYRTGGTRMGKSYPVRNLIPIRRANREALLALGAHNRTPNHLTYALPIGLASALAAALREPRDA